MPAGRRICKCRVSSCPPTHLPRPRPATPRSYKHMQERAQPLLLTLRLGSREMHPFHSLLVQRGKPAVAAVAIAVAPSGPFVSPCARGPLLPVGPFIYDLQGARSLFSPCPRPPHPPARPPLRPVARIAFGCFFVYATNLLDPSRRQGTASSRPAKIAPTLHTRPRVALPSRLAKPSA